jgi:signal transduction histidine kinase
VLGLLRRVQRGIERSCERLGLSYPWWIPAYSALTCIALTIAAYVQRGALAPSLPTIAALILTLSPIAVWALLGWLVPPWIEALTTTVAVALYLTQPVAPDFAPLLFMIVAGEVAATSRIWPALILSTVEIAVLVVAAESHHLQSAPLYIVGVVLGVDVGIALRWQMRALAAERANTSIAQQQAMLAERQRVAREVHDVVGHSLSINLLHVTAARYSLQQHADITDAIDSLVEAERVGREAMSDLRRTVAVLSAGPAATQPLPGIADVPALIEQSRLAGLNVQYERTGDGSAIGDAAGLCLYRIAQECLANIAKHAPTAAASVCLDVDADSVRLVVRNTLPAGTRRAAKGGTGLAGMAARAEQMGAQLHTGVDDGNWFVDLILPAVDYSATPAGTT